MDNSIQYIKKKRLVDHASDNPLYVIKLVFTIDRLDSIKDCCQRWLKLTFINKDPINKYHDDKQLSVLLAFYYNLLVLLEALHIIYSIREKVKIKCPEYLLLDQQQQANPLEVVNNFCNSFSLVYIHRELWDWLRAGIIFAGTYSKEFNEADVISTHDFILCLTEAAHGLYKQEKEKQVFSSVYFTLWNTCISNAV
jgi:hypothetical protein